MSGAEVITVVGLISSAISIIETARGMYDAATDANGLHEAFRTVSQNISLVLNILRACKRVQEQADRDLDTSTDPAQRRELEESASAVRPVMIACRENAQELKQIFEKVMPGDQATRMERYRKAAQAVMPGKKRRVEELMKDILEKLQLLQANQVFKAETENRREALDLAILQLSELSPSLPDEYAYLGHTASRSTYFNASPGIQQNYNLGGTPNNQQNNRQYIAQIQHFGKE